MEMRALQLVQPRSFEPVFIPVPEAGQGILVRTGWVSLCGSDIAFFNGSKRGMGYPLPAGAPVHECTGQVVSSTANGLQPGDWVLAIPDHNRGLAEFFTARAERVLRLPADLPRYDTCCLIQPLATVINGIDALGDVRGRAVCVIGLGSIGLLFCWLLKQRGATLVCGVDPNPRRCALAADFGADCTCAMRSIELAHRSRGGANWQPPDIVVEAVGHQTETINDSLELVARGGTILAFGVPDKPVYPIEYETFFRKNARLQAVVTPVWADALPKALDLFLAHQSLLETLFTHCYGISQAGRAFEAYETQRDGLLKVLLNAACWGEDCE